MHVHYELILNVLRDCIRKWGGVEYGTLCSATPTVVQNNKMGGTSVSSLWAGVIVQRLLTFSLNAVLVRFASAAELGFASNDMELLLATIVFLSRESSRLVALRKAGAASDRVQQQQLINVAWLPVVPGILAACLCGTLYNRSAARAAAVDQGASVIAGQHTAVLLYCCAAMLELLSEPFYILTQSQLLYRARATTEICASVLKVAITLVLVVRSPLGGAQAFACGQIAYSTCLLLGYAYFALQLVGRSTGAHVLWPCFLPVLPSRALSTATGSRGTRNGGGSRDTATGTSGSVVTRWLQAQLGTDSLSLLAGFTGQTAVKHVLTEFDRILLLSLVTHVADRGEYAFAANYGSLAARLLFQPVEEAVRGYVSKAQDKLHASRVFLSVARGVSLAGSLFAVFGYCYSGTLVRLVFGKWAQTRAPDILAAYCIYVFCMALNGVTEAFVAAMADNRRLFVGNVHMGVSAVTCTGLAVYALPRYGMASLVWINCLGMLLRTASSVLYIRSTVRRLESEAGSAQSPSVGQLLPNSITTASIASTAIVLHLAAARLPAPVQQLPVYSADSLQYLAVGVACGVGLLGMVARLEAASVLQAWRELQGRASAPITATAATEHSAQRRTTPARRAKAS